jgi:hypothetical protein
MKGRDLIMQTGAKGYPYRPDPDEEEKRLNKWKENLSCVFYCLSLDDTDRKLSKEGIVIRYTQVRWIFELIVQ